MGLDKEKRYCRYHRVLSRAAWSTREASRILLGLLVEESVPHGPLVRGVDETLERRQGKKIAAKGIYRDPVEIQPHPLRQNECFEVGLPDAFGSDPMGLSGLGFAVPFAARPFRTLHERTRKATQEAYRVGLAIAFAGEALAASCRKLVAVADGGYASLELLDRCRGLRKPITFITRLRLDAALYEPAPPRYPGQMGRPRLKGDRLPNLSVVAEDPKTDWTPMKVVNWYGREQRTVEVFSATAVWYSSGLPVVPLRWVLIRDPEGEFDTQALLCHRP